MSVSLTSIIDYEFTKYTLNSYAPRRAEAQYGQQPRPFGAPLPPLGGGAGPALRGGAEGRREAAGKLKICVSGRIKGADKAKKLVVQSGALSGRRGGKLKPQSLDAVGVKPRLDYVSRGIYTKWGVLGLKVYARHGAGRSA